jgi:predicted DNA-binding transcriptional regulator AlpA
MTAYTAIPARPPAEPVLPPLAVSEADAARLIGVSARTLWTLRRDGRGPRHVLIGSSVRYRVDAIREYLVSLEQTEGGAT